MQYTRAQLHRLKRETITAKGILLSTLDAVIYNLRRLSAKLRFQKSRRLWIEVVGLVVQNTSNWLF